MKLPELADLEEVSRLVYGSMQASPQIEWPLLSERAGCRVLVKHENHNPTGAFKVRGGLHYLTRLLQREPGVSGLVTATRGNHGQSIAYAAQGFGLPCVVVVPEGNDPDKNRAMAAFGAELVVHGRDFDEAVPFAAALADERGWHRIPSFHPDLVCGVATYGLELLRQCPDLRRVYVPVGLGSGICGLIAARAALRSKVEIVGVVSTEADCYARSLAAGTCVATESAQTLADGVAVREPNAEALEMMLGEVARIVTVSDQEILYAMGALFADTHNVVEGAGGASLAALLQERTQNAGEEVAVIVSGGNVNSALFAKAPSAVAVA